VHLYLWFLIPSFCKNFFSAAQKTKISRRYPFKRFCTMLYLYIFLFNQAQRDLLLSVMNNFKSDTIDIKLQSAKSVMV
jgi:hypothetical protein